MRRERAGKEAEMLEHFRRKLEAVVKGLSWEHLQMQRSAGEERH